MTGGNRVTIEPVRDKRDLGRFIAVPFDIYRDDPNWVAPLNFERRQHLDRKRNPYFQHAEAELFVAVRDGRPVGRISAQIDRLDQERQGADLGHFGFIEAIDDPAVFDALFEAAEGWLKARGIGRVRGPFNFSINDECGLLIEGFDLPPVFLTGHARRWYADHVEARGYAKARDTIAYRFDIRGEPLPAVARRLVDRTRNVPNITVRPLRMKSFDEELRIIIGIFNDAWSGNWGFVPFTQAEMDRVASDLKMVLRPEFGQIVEMDGEPVAFGILLPNMNEAMADLNGSLLPFGWAKLAWRLLGGRIRSCRLPLMGVRSHLHSTAIGAALAFMVIDRIYAAAAQRGFREAELSWILEDNLPMRRMIESAGGMPYKAWRIYEKSL
ncbi:hypothetical protein ABIE65_001927 [Constrictibacter sp. MBR-5]|jgi:hypothetical protein|uniref:dATP pyrophosphohydrolase n=1 Tax=Constrictibacter sp. MBR-5 TaxID=3156467 RepID=UPI0033928BBE